MTKTKINLLLLLVLLSGSIKAATPSAERYVPTPIPGAIDPRDGLTSRAQQHSPAANDIPFYASPITLEDKSIPWPPLNGRLPDDTVTVGWSLWSSAVPAMAESVAIDAIPSLRLFLNDTTKAYFEPNARIHEGLYEFQLQANGVRYQAAGVRRLQTLLREIAATQELRQALGNLYQPEVVEARRRGWGVALKSAFVDEADTGLPPGSEGILQREARDIAFMLKVDTYTDNIILRRGLLIGAERWLRGRPFNLSPIPPHEVEITPMHNEEVLDELLRQRDLDTMRATLASTHREVFAADRSEMAVVDIFLANKFYTPYRLTRAWRYLVDLRDVEGRKDAIQQLATVKTPREAARRTEQLELLALLHRRRALVDRAGLKRLLSFTEWPEIWCALDLDNRLIAVSSDDIIHGTSGRETIRNIVNKALELELEEADFLTTGEIRSEVLRLAKHGGVTVWQNISAQPEFQLPRVAVVETLPPLQRVASSARVNPLALAFDIPESTDIVAPADVNLPGVSDERERRRLDTNESERRRTRPERPDSHIVNSDDPPRNNTPITPALPTSPRPESGSRRHPMLDNY